MAENSRHVCNWKFIAPIDIDGFGQCDVEVEIDVCQFETTTDIDFFVEDGVLNWYEAAGDGDAGDGDDGTPGQPEEPPGDTGPDAIFCDPCKPAGSYVGGYQDLFTVGGEGSGAIYAGTVTVNITDPTTNPDNDGKTGIKATIEDGECCCTGDPAPTGAQEYVLPVTPVSLGELRGNVNNRPLPACDECGCQDEGGCYGSFNDACPGFVSVIETMIEIEKNNCI